MLCAGMLAGCGAGNSSGKAGEPAESVTAADTADDPYAGAVKAEPAAAPAEIVPGSGTCGESLTWVLDEKGTLTISGTGDMDNYYATKESPFRENESVRRLVVEDGVTRIGSNAFYGCKWLNEVKLPGSLKVIGQEAFSNNEGITSVTIPERIKELPFSVFEECTALASVTFEGDVTSIDCAAFEDCVSLKSIAIPGSVTEIDESVFKGCTALENVVLPDGVAKIGRSAFEDCAALKQITIPESVTAIGKYSFRGCPEMKEVTLPAGLEDIGEEMFGFIKDDSGDSAMVKGFKIRSAKGSKAEEYAGYYGFDFEAV